MRKIDERTYVSGQVDPGDLPPDEGGAGQRIQ